MRGATGDWEVVIGMEVHAQVASKAKLFSGASTEFGGEPNSHVSLVDAAMPGMLPVINEACIAQAVRTGLGLKAQINLVSVFDRKNYFYPDLPQGYQISQYKRPIVGEGEVEVDVDGETVRVGIERLHLEQDAGKSIHDQHPEYILRRSQPLGRGADGDRVQARHALRQAGAGLHLQGAHHPALPRHLRRRHGEGQPARRRERLGAPAGRRSSALAARSRTSTRSASSAKPIEYEARRQIDVIEDGGMIEQETRLFDALKARPAPCAPRRRRTTTAISPTPTCLPLELTQDYVDALKKDLPELPDAKKSRFISRIRNRLDGAAVVLTLERSWADYFEGVAQGRDAKLSANWIINDLFGRLNKEEIPIEDSPISPKQLGAIIDLIASGAISGKIAKDVFEIVWNEGGDPAEIVEKRGLRQVTDTGAIETAVDAVIAANPDKVADAKAKPAMRSAGSSARS